MVSYDFNSFYQWVIAVAKLTFPVSAPEFKTITAKDVEKYYNYGVYRAKVTGEHPFFRFNKKYYYTHVDLTSARSIGLNVELIEDGQVNAMLYTTKRVVGNTVFGKFVKMMYQLKLQDVPLSKQLLTCLWGALCKTMKYSKSTAEAEASIDLSDTNIKYIVPNDSTMKHDTVTYSKKTESRYQFTFGRFKPFILAFARSKLMQTADKYRDHIVRIHTDSMVMDANVKTNLDIGTGIGQWKIEKSGNLDITNLNKLSWTKTA